MVIAHNMLAMNAQRQYGITTSDRKKSTEKLSSGYKINRAADDAAGLTISEKMRSQIRGLNQGSDNIQDGISLVQIADGALAEVNDMLHRITELSVKSANGTNTAEDRAAIQKEVQQLIGEIDRIHESTEFNTMPLFDGIDPGTAPKDNLTKLITTPGGAVGKMNESFTYNGATKGAASLDFSGINTSNISRLYGKGFSFTCAAGCSEVFSFTFANGGGSKLVQGPAPGGESNRYSINYTIDISGCTTSNEVVSRLWNYVYTNKPSVDGGQNLGDTQAMKVGHANGLYYNPLEPNKLVVFAVGAGTSNSGTVDCSGLEPEQGKVKNFWIQASGSSPNDGMNMEVERMDAEYIGIDTIDVSTQPGAKTAIDMVKNATSMVSGMRSDLGAYQNRLEHAYANNENKAENTQAAESRIRDTDMATEMMKNTKESILMQANEAMMAQANQSTQSVLSLLQ